MQIYDALTPEINIFQDFLFVLHWIKFVNLLSLWKNQNKKIAESTSLLDSASFLQHDGCMHFKNIRISGLYLRKKVRSSSNVVFDNC